jgi:hypothetical protein
MQLTNSFVTDEMVLFGEVSAAEPTDQVRSRLREGIGCEYCHDVLHHCGRSLAKPDQSSKVVVVVAAVGEFGNLRVDGFAEVWLDLRLSPLLHTVSPVSWASKKTGRPTVSKSKVPLVMPIWVTWLQDTWAGSLEACQIVTG